MTKDKTIKAFKKKANELATKRKDLRFQKTMALLKAKGLLDTNLAIEPRPSLRLDIRDVLWAGQHVEPRILEVLPAAILHFPKNFIGVENAPKEFLQVLEYIKKNMKKGPDFEGLEYDKMKFWADTKLKDGRTKSTLEKRRPKSFRLHPDSLQILEKLVNSGQFANQTLALEAAIGKMEK